MAGIYLVLVFLGLFLAARRLWGPGAALLAVALALLGTDVFTGAAPSWGTSRPWRSSCWLPGSSSETGKADSTGHLFLGGLFLGLAFDAKEFYGLAFLPPLAALVWQSWREPRRFWPPHWPIYPGVWPCPCWPTCSLRRSSWAAWRTRCSISCSQKKLLCHEFFTPLTIGRIYPESCRYLLNHPLFWLAGGLRWIWKKAA